MGRHQWIIRCGLWDCGCALGGSGGAVCRSTFSAILSKALGLEVCKSDRREPANVGIKPLARAWHSDSCFMAQQIVLLVSWLTASMFPVNNCSLLLNELRG
jgi:hypothetical protein